MAPMCDCGVNAIIRYPTTRFQDFSMILHGTTVFSKICLQGAFMEVTSLTQRLMHTLCYTNLFT